MKIVAAVVGLLCGAAFTSAKQSRLCSFHDSHLIHVCTAATASCLDIMKLTATLCGFVMLGTQSQDQGRCDHREFLTRDPSQCAPLWMSSALPDHYRTFCSVQLALVKATTLLATVVQADKVNSIHLSRILARL
jgi:hypothetical protein